MTKTVVGLFDDFRTAQDVIRDLVDHGISRENISLIANDAEGNYSRELGDQSQQAEGVGETKGEAAAKGAGLGAALGGITGLLIGIGVFALPGIGPVLGAGPLIATLSGIGIGAVTGGIVGALTEAGIPDEDADIYAEGVRRGGTLVMVYVADEMADQAADVMNRHNPINIEERSAAWRGENWSGFDENAGPFAFDRGTQTFRDRQATSQLDYLPEEKRYVAGQPVSDYDRSKSDLGNYQNQSASDDWVMFEPRFREHFVTHYNREGLTSGTWEDYRDIYHFGFLMGRQDRYANGDWDLVRDDIHREWDTRYPNVPWDKYEDAVYEGWRTGRQH